MEHWQLLASTILHNDQYKTKSKPNTVHEAAETGSIKQLEQHVRKALVLGTPESVTLQQREDVLGMMPIHLAAEHGQYDVVEFLIKKRADLDAGDNFKVTAMHLAAIEGHYGICKLLLDSRAAVAPVDVEGDLPIHWAATKGHEDIIELLVQYGSPLDKPNNKGWTPFHRAAYNGRKKALDMLVKRGANIEAATKDGNTALHLACFMNLLPTEEALLGHGARMDVLNDRDKTPYDLCISDGAKEMLENYKFAFTTMIEKKASGLLLRAGSKPVQTSQQQQQEAEAISRLQDLSVQVKNLRKAAKKDEFPDLASPKARHSSDGSVADEEDRDTGHSVRSEFLYEAAQALEPLGGTQSPYVGLGTSHLPPVAAVTADSGLGLRSSPAKQLQGSASGTSSLQEPADLFGRPPSSGVRPSSRSGLNRPLTPLTSATSLVSLAPKVSLGLATTHSTGTPTAELLGAWDAGPKLSADEFQQSVKDENRRLAAAAAGTADSLAPRQRPVSANKKFLSKYNLDKLNLFAP